MGQITIEIPQSFNQTYRIVSDDSAKEILSLIERLIKQNNAVGGDEVLGIWADRRESVEEIARRLRQGWDRSDKNG